MKKLLAFVAAAAAACMLFSACSSDRDYNGEANYPYYPDSPSAPDLFDPDNYQYDDVIENGFSDVSEQPSSYFSLDRNTANYSIVRSQIERGQRISPSSVRIEELINYFDYDFPAPTDKAVGLTSQTMYSCPWNPDNSLIMVGLKTAEHKPEYSNSNYVFLIDVSGSMSGDSRLGLAKQGLNLLVDELGSRDLVSIVTYASGVSTVLDGGECSTEGKKQIKAAIADLYASGATNGGDGLERAYRIARDHFITGGNNRVIIISDGDFNVGMSSTNEMKEFIQEQAKSGVYLSVLGVGMGNMRDDMLQTLALCGNGNYAYLDSVTEARKVLVDELGGTLVTVAKDAKACVTFSDRVKKYRLVGYDSKLISEDDFNNDKTDAGEIGSNLCVAALYEVEINGNDFGGVFATAEVRYKDVTGAGEVSESVTRDITFDDWGSDIVFASCVAEFGLALRNSQYAGGASLDSVLRRLEIPEFKSYYERDIYKNEFAALVQKAYDSGYYVTDYDTTFGKVVDAINDGNLELGFLENVKDKDLSFLQPQDGWFGAMGYYNSDYAEGDEFYVNYVVSSYPDACNHTSYVIYITVTDPNVTFYGENTVRDCDEFLSFLENLGFEKNVNDYDTVTSVRLKKYNFLIVYTTYKDKETSEIIFRYNGTNIFGITY